MHGSSLTGGSPELMRRKRLSRDVVQRLRLVFDSFKLEITGKKGLAD